MVWLNKLRELDDILTKRYGMFISGSPLITYCINDFYMRFPTDRDAIKGMEIIHAFNQRKITRSKRFY